MKSRKEKPRSLGLYVLIILIGGSIVYNLYDNHRFIVVTQEITMDRLPPSFESFTILQISDLHGRYFGKHQANLIKSINSLQYDMIAFTGDMNSNTVIDDSIDNSQAILDLLDGLENKEYIFWVDGNTGPHAIEAYGGAKTGELTDIGEVLQNKGCKMLTLPYAITRKNETIWITPRMSEIVFASAYGSGDEEWYGGKENYVKIQAFYQRAYEAFQEINGNDELKIMLDHFPQQTNITAEELEQSGDLDYDLILAGHYHGGQWRLPFSGALYIPSPTTGINNSGYFPSQRDVKGWSYYGDTPQYVSAGLGASGHTPLGAFRLFNTPEINLIILKSRSGARASIN